MKFCKAAAKGLLKTLGDLGYHVSAKKAQLSQTEVTYWGYILKGGKARKETILRISRPSNCQEVSKFLGSAGLCRL